MQLSKVWSWGSIRDCSIGYVQLLLTELKACSRTRNLERGKQFHAKAVEYGHDSNIYVATALINMYAKCGSMADAREIFDSIKHPNVVSWTALILGYADNGQGHSALNLFDKMRTEGPPPDSVAFVAALKACTTLAVTGGMAECRGRGKEIHNLAKENGCNSDVYVQSALVDMYAKCGNVVEAREIFDCMKCPNVVSWTALILGYADNGQGDIALYLFRKMRIEGPEPDSIAFVAALKACTSLAVNKGHSEWMECRNRGKALNNSAVENGCSSHMYVQNTLVDLYAECGSMVYAREVFDSMKHPTVVSWNTLILGYAENGQSLTSLELFSRMKIEGPAPNSITFMAALKACGLIGALELGRTIHLEINSRSNVELRLVNCLVDFYAKCGSLTEAQSVFDLAETRNMVTWNVLLAGLSSCGDEEGVFRVFQRMQDAGFWPDGITFLCILTCCAHAGLVEKGKELFDAMYTKYGIVRTVEHYNCMADIFGRANRVDEAMALLQSMPCSPDDVTWKTILGACRKGKYVDVGRLAFQSLINLGDSDSAGYVLMEQTYGNRCI